MERHEAIKFVRETEEKFGGWTKIMVAWARGWIKSEDFNAYLFAQRIIRREEIF